MIIIIEFLRLLKILETTVTACFFNMLDRKLMNDSAIKRFSDSGDKYATKVSFLKAVWLDFNTDLNTEVSQVMNNVILCAETRSDEGYTGPISARMG